MEFSRNVEKNKRQKRRKSFEVYELPFFLGKYKKNGRRLLHLRIFKGYINR